MLSRGGLSQAGMVGRMRSVSQVWFYTSIKDFLKYICDLIRYYHVMKNLSDEAIVTCWQKNVAPWIAAVRNGRIASRLLVTDKAIVGEVLNCKPKNVIDIGCGEGWLARELSLHGIDVLGIDAIPALVTSAQQLGGGRFKTAAFEQVSQVTASERFDVAVCNFSLLGDQSVTNLFAQIPSLLNDRGILIVQTLHPLAGGVGVEYKDGWREGSWAGIDGEFSEPAPWYFRTLAGWRSLFSEHGFVLNAEVEPWNPKTGQPASIIFLAELVFNE